MRGFKNIATIIFQQQLKAFDEPYLFITFFVDGTLKSQPAFANKFIS